MNLETQGQFGPAGMILTGTWFDREHRYLLRESFEYLDHALVILKQTDYYAWLALWIAYLGDSSDPSLVDDWRVKSAKSERAKTSLDHHDRGVWSLTEMLLEHDLYCVPPSRMTSTQEKQVDKRNDELYGLYIQLKKDGLSKSKSVKQAAEWTGYHESRAWEIIRLREGGEPRERKKKVKPKR